MPTAAEPPQRGDHAPLGEGPLGEAPLGDAPLGDKPLGTKPAGSADPAAMFTVDDFEVAARERLESSVYDFVVGGAGNEDSISHNRRALQRLRILSRTMIDVSHIDMSTSVLGIDLAMPLFVAPSAMQRLSHPDGERAVASAAAAAGIPMILSMNTSTTIDDVAESGVPLLLQMYIYRDRSVTEELIARAEQAGVKALCPTVDAAVMHWRVRELRNPLQIPADVEFKHLPGPRGGGLESNITWEMFEWLRGVTDLPIVLKGILDPADAARAADEGADGIIVSNHGGRQVAGAVSAWDVLPEVAERVAGRIPVLADGGIRDGVDLFRAIALGADAALIGRPAVWALAAAGQPGVERLLEILRTEFESVMGWTGSTSLAGVTSDRLVRVD